MRNASFDKMWNQMSLCHAGPCKLAPHTASFGLHTVLLSGSSGGALEWCVNVMLQSMADAEGKIPVIKSKNCYPKAALQKPERNIFTISSHQYPFKQND